MSHHRQVGAGGQQEEQPRNADRISYQADEQGKLIFYALR